MVLDCYSTPLSPLSHSLLMKWCVYKHQEWYTLKCGTYSAYLLVFTKCCEIFRLWITFASLQQCATTSEERFLVRGLHKLKFKTCLDSWSVQRLALDNVEQSQSSCVIFGLSQEKYAEKPITYFSLQVSISNIVIRAFIGCSQCHRHI